MNIIDADVICFDADLTLIKYTIKEFIKLEYTSLAKTLIKLGAPDELLTIINPDDTYKIGCPTVIADFSTGYLLKTAEDGTIIKAYFGLEEVTDLESSYGSPPIYELQQFDKYYVAGERYVFFTHFGIGGSVIWQTCVELMKQGKFQIGNYIDLSLLFRQGIVNNYLIHDRNESEYYKELYSHPELYLTKIPQVFKEKLKLLRDSDKKLVVVTNSQEDYANFIFEYSYGSDWHCYFDAYVFSAGKPEFFFSDEDLEIIEHLNLDGDAFIKGSSRHLKDTVGGHKYAFIGDHYLGDVHGPKQKNWKTIAVVEELFYEKSIGNIKVPEEVENSPYCKPDVDALDYYDKWGSHFIDKDKRTYWWKFLTIHADIIIPTIESFFTCFNI